jgi:hypothetical protein
MTALQLQWARLVQRARVMLTIVKMAWYAYKAEAKSIDAVLWIESGRAKITGVVVHQKAPKKKKRKWGKQK